MPASHLLTAFGALLRDVAAREILPRFRTLAAAEVHSKATAEDPDDLVTSADHAAEAALPAACDASSAATTILSTRRQPSSHASSVGADRRRAQHLS